MLFSQLIDYSVSSQLPKVERDIVKFFCQTNNSKQGKNTYYCKRIRKSRPEIVNVKKKQKTVGLKEQLIIIKVTGTTDKLG